MKKPKYKFSEEGHVHQLLVNGEYKNLTGCTTVLSVLAKPLTWWASGKAVETLGWYNPKQQNGETEEEYEKRIVAGKKKLPKVFSMIKELSEEDYFDTLNTAYKAHSEQKERSGEYGKEIHAKIEDIIKQAIALNDGIIAEQKSGDRSVQNFIDWAVKNKARFLESEKHVYSEKHFLGGVIDIVLEIDGQKWIGDIKTSQSGIYPEHFWQCGGYQLMLQEMGLYPNITGYIILNLKKSGVILEKRSISNEDSKKAFMACLTIYRLLEKVKGTIL